MFHTFFCTLSLKSSINQPLVGPFMLDGFSALNFATNTRNLNSAESPFLFKFQDAAASQMFERKTRRAVWRGVRT